MKPYTAKEICLTAVMTALVFAATFFPRIPIPIGYVHLGDGVIFLLALLTPGRSTRFAACAGSALSDLLSGFPLWIVPTILIKFAMAETVRKTAGDARTLPRIVFAFLCGTAIMTAGYTLFGWLLYDSLAVALASVPGLLAKGIVNSAIAATLLCPIRARIPAHTVS